MDLHPRALVKSYAVQRAAAAGLSFSALLLAAREIPTAPYAVILQAMFLAKFLQVLNLGVVNGFFISKYTGTGPMAEDDADQKGRFMTALCGQYVLITLVLLAAAFGFAPQYAVGALAFVILSPIYAMEPVLRDKRQFYVSLVPDITMALALFTMIALGLETASSFLWSLFALTACFGLILLLHLKALDLRWSLPPLPTPTVMGLSRIGAPVWLATAAFMLASSADRLIFPLHGTDADLARYFLGFQLVTGAMLFISALNFVNVVDLGQSNREHGVPSHAAIMKKLRTASLIALASLAALAVGVVLLERFFLDAQEYGGLAIITCILGVGLALFYIAGTITPLLGYLKRQLPMTWAMGGLALILWGNNMVAFYAGYGPMWLVCGTALGFSLYAIIAIIYTLRATSEASLADAGHEAS